MLKIQMQKTTLISMGSLPIPVEGLIVREECDRCFVEWDSPTMRKNPLVLFAIVKKTTEGDRRFDIIFPWVRWNEQDKAFEAQSFNGQNCFILSSPLKSAAIGKPCGKGYAPMGGHFQ